MSQHNFNPLDKLKELAKISHSTSFCMPKDSLESRINEYIDLFKEEYLIDMYELKRSAMLTYLQFQIDCIRKFYDSPSNTLVVWFENALTKIRETFEDKRTEVSVIVKKTPSIIARLGWSCSPIIYRLNS